MHQLLLVNVNLSGAVIFSLNNWKNSNKSCNLIFCNIQEHFNGDIPAKCGIPNSPQSLAIGENSDEVVPIFRFLVNIPL